MSNVESHPPDALIPYGDEYLVPRKKPTVLRIRTLDWKGLRRKVERISASGSRWYGLFFTLLGTTLSGVMATVLAEPPEPAGRLCYIVVTAVGFLTILSFCLANTQAKFLAHTKDHVLEDMDSIDAQFKLALVDLEQAIPL